MYPRLTKHGGSLSLRPLPGRTLPTGFAPAEPARTASPRAPGVTACQPERPDTQPASPPAWLHSEERRSSPPSPQNGWKARSTSSKAGKGEDGRALLPEEEDTPSQPRPSCHAGSAPPETAADRPAPGTPPHKQCSLYCPYPPALSVFPSLPIAADTPGARRRPNASSPLRSVPH